MIRHIVHTVGFFLGRSGMHIPQGPSVDDESVGSVSLSVSRRSSVRLDWRRPLCWVHRSDGSASAGMLTRQPSTWWGKPHHAQSTATSSAAQSCRMRWSLRRPRRSASAATATLSTESRFATHCRGTGSSPGSSATSLARSRIVVVHGAMSARRRRGIAASRERTTTGRRPISGSSHHHTSPRAGRLTNGRPLPGTMPGHPIRRVRQGVAPHRPDSSRRAVPPALGRAAPPERHRATRRRSSRRALAARSPAAHHRPSCSLGPAA